MDDVQIADIAKELAKLHKAQAEKKEIRASLFTLIIYVHEEQRSRYLQDIVQNIIEKYPCRIIFIKADRNPSSNHLRVKVSSAQSSKGGTLIACDQITIEVAGKYMNRVPFLVIPHLLTDLPIHLLWGQDPTCENEILPTLEKLADRIIFDAECTKNLRQFACVILEMHKSLHIELLDINWALLSGWKDIVTQAFYLPEHLIELINSKEINITFNNEQSDWVHQPEMQSIYLQAWLAARLKWRFKSMSWMGEERLVTYTGPKGDIAIKILPSANPLLPPGGIISFEVSSYDGYHFNLQHDRDRAKVTVNCSSEVMCELPFTLPLADIKRGFAFMNEIFYARPSPHYIEVLELLNNIDWK